jgi:hypothetical protein
MYTKMLVRIDDEGSFYHGLFGLVDVKDVDSLSSVEVWMNKAGTRKGYYHWTELEIWLG